MSESLARVHVHQLEEPKAPVLTNDNEKVEAAPAVEAIPNTPVTHPEAANDNEKSQPILTTYPEAANDNEVTDNAKIAELRERLGMVSEKSPVTQGMAAQELVPVPEPTPEVPALTPEEIERAVREASIEDELGHAETAEDNQAEQGRALQAAGGAERQDGGGGEGVRMDMEGDAGGNAPAGGSRMKGFLGKLLTLPWKGLKLLGGVLLAVVALSFAALKKASELTLSPASKSGSGPKPKPKTGGGGGAAGHH